jgi:hypothetical protein
MCGSSFAAASDTKASVVVVRTVVLGWSKSGVGPCGIGRALSWCPTWDVVRSGRVDVLEPGSGMAVVVEFGAGVWQSQVGDGVATEGPLGLAVGAGVRII